MLGVPVSSRVSPFHPRFSSNQEKERRKLQKQPVILNHNTDRDATEATRTQPTAEISPQGDLRIGDQTVQVNDSQREQLQDYHRRTVDLGVMGVAIEESAEAMGKKILREAAGAAIKGNSDELKQSATSGLETVVKQMLQMCDQMGVLRERQQQLASTITEFAPYATIRQLDIESCKREAKSALQN